MPPAFSLCFLHHYSGMNTKADNERSEPWGQERLVGLSFASAVNCQLEADAPMVRAAVLGKTE
jgi:hypothetical protein